MDEYINSTNILKGGGYLVFLGILMLIAYLNGHGIPNKTPIYVFAIITWLIFVLLPLGMNRDCETGYLDYFCLGEIGDDLDELPDGERLTTALKRSFWNVVITAIFFAFATNAIAKNGDWPTAFDPTSLPGVPQKIGENFKQLSISLTKPLSHMVYMAIIIIIINVISNMYIYFNCDDKLQGNKKYTIRSFILSQYNIVLITLVGIVTLIVVKNHPENAIGGVARAAASASVRAAAST